MVPIIYKIELTKSKKKTHCEQESTETNKTGHKFFQIPKFLPTDYKILAYNV